MSVYDDINERCQYDDLNERAMQLDVLADQADDCDQQDKPPPQLPRLRSSVYLEVLQDQRSTKGSITGSIKGSIKSSRPIKSSEPSTPRPDAKSDHGNRPATPRLEVTSPDDDQGGNYEGLKTEEHDDHKYAGVKSESEERVDNH